VHHRRHFRKRGKREVLGEMEVEDEGDGLENTHTFAASGL
jgi:hypothetical protein